MGKLNYYRNELIIYTRVNEMFYKITFDFIEMADRTISIKSYENTNWDIIDQSVYNQHHPFEFGSSVIINNIRRETICFNKKSNNMSSPKSTAKFFYFTI